MPTCRYYPHFIDAEFEAQSGNAYIKWWQWNMNPGRVKADSETSSFKPYTTALLNKYIAK